MMACTAGKECALLPGETLDNFKQKADPCGSNMAYLYFLSFVFLSTFLVSSLSLPSPSLPPPYGLPSQICGAAHVHFNLM